MGRLALLGLALLMLASFAFSASIKDACPDKQGRPDDFCISNKASTAADCRQMSPDSVFLDSCYQNVIPSINDCNEIPTKDARKQCAIRNFYSENRNDSSACGRIEPEYEQDCYIYFVEQKYPSDLDGCDTIPSGYQKECQKKLLRGMLGFSPNEEFCSTLKSRYNEVCLQAVKEQKEFISTSMGIMGAVFGLFGLIFASPFICCGLVVIIIAVIAVAFYFHDRKTKK